MIGESLAFVALVGAVAAPLCGHQAQPWPLGGAWRRLKARMPRRGLLRGLGGPEGPFRLPRSLRDAPGASQGPSRRPPSWAHTQPLDYEESA